MQYNDFFLYYYFIGRQATMYCFTFNLLFLQLNADNLRIQYNFNITLDHRKFGEMFIVCGHLYAIDSGQEKNSQIRYAVDLYNGNLLNIDLPFTNPFRKTTTVGYNPYTVVRYLYKLKTKLSFRFLLSKSLLIQDIINFSRSM